MPRIILDTERDVGRMEFRVEDKITFEDDEIELILRDLRQLVDNLASILDKRKTINVPSNIGEINLELGEK